ncbi:kinase-like protein [Aspergillus heteromorphus CBS 117.55]|uniref:Kinase-like protein n=1 Tax=Aspergillus heteromorphus CBS 117.55 TaxID=1448321 RepID=A0A317X438_9EURO|nr:kinase-like protein [Aspergillus heteromorphus CBS 117.55]PWY92372.1 kinase-like protein [Aspergillus heteromorphus CBS 117.55]
MSDTAVESETQNPRPELLDRICHVLDTTQTIHYAPSLQATRPPIVTKDAILQAQDLSPHRINNSYLLELTPTQLLKVGPSHRVQLSEAEAMILARQQTALPIIPRVFNAYLIDDIGFILMEKLPGDQLDDSWEGLSRAMKVSVAEQLRGYVEAWRRIRGPFYGAVDGGPCLDVVFHHPWENVRYAYGPFGSRREFNRGLVEALRNSRPGGRLSGRDEGFVEMVLEAGVGLGDAEGEGEGDEEVKVLTHGDLHPSNILVRDGVITGIVDWGAAGYSVPEREYFCMRWSALDPEWIELLTTVLPDDGYEFWKELNYQMMAYTCI